MKILADKLFRKHQNFIENIVEIITQYVEIILCVENNRQNIKENKPI